MLSSYCSSEPRIQVSPSCPHGWSVEPTIGLPSDQSLYEPPPEARPATAPTQRTVDTSYLPGPGKLGSPGRLFRGHHALRGSHVDAVAEGRGPHRGLRKDAEAYLLEKEIENVAMETELFNLDDRRCLSRNMKNHLIKMHKQHEKNLEQQLSRMPSDTGEASLVKSILLTRKTPKDRDKELSSDELKMFEEEVLEAKIKELRAWVENDTYESVERSA